MPIFEYRCAGCAEVFEHLVLGRRDHHVECPRCGGSEVKQMVSRFATQTRSDSGAEQCFSRSAGVCEAGGGPMT